MRPKSTVLSPLRNSSVTAATAIFLVLVCVVVTGLMGWTIWQERSDQLDESKVTTDNMARSLARHADDTFKAADTSLLGLTERVTVDGTSPHQLERLHKLLVLRVEELPQLQALSILDKNGQRLVTSLTSPTSKDQYTNSKEREYFQYHVNHASSGPHIGVPFQTHSSNAWVIPLSRRLDDENGQFGGVIIATVSVKYFTDFYQTFDIGHEGAITLILNDGIQIARQPLLPDSLGKNLSNGPLYKAYVSGNGSGSAMIESMQDGIERLNGYQRLTYYPLFVSAALSKYEILASWRHLFIIRGLITLGIIILFIVAGTRLIKQIKLRIHAEEEAKNARDALQELNATLEKLAQQDGLTGLANRRKFDEVLDASMQQARSSASPLAIILIDVDYFKKFNDLYGHVAGDECLRQVGKVIKDCEKRSCDLAARYGGEEFVVLLPDTDLAGALVVAEAIRKAIRALKIEHIGNTAGVVTISAGVDVLTSLTHQISAEMLVNAADKALYEAKASGRDQIHFYRTTPRTP